MIGGEGVGAGAGDGADVGGGDGVDEGGQEGPWKFSGSLDYSSSIEYTHTPEKFQVPWKFPGPEKIQGPWKFSGSLEISSSPGNFQGGSLIHLGRAVFRLRRFYQVCRAKVFFYKMSLIPGLEKMSGRKSYLFGVGQTQSA